MFAFAAFILHRSWVEQVDRDDFDKEQTNGPLDSLQSSKPWIYAASVVGE